MIRKTLIVDNRKYISNVVWQKTQKNAREKAKEEGKAIIDVLKIANRSRTREIETN